MKTLIWGMGSIGRKHFENLQILGVPDIEIYDPEKGFDIPHGLIADYDLIIIATPAHLHLEHLHYFVERKAKYIMLEKPLCTLPTIYQEMPELTIYKPIESEIYINNAYRFERGLMKLKELCEQGVAGEIGGVFMENWYSFKKMHPQWDEKDFEGVIYDDSHIINTSRWLWGEPTEIFSKRINKMRATFEWVTDKGIEVHHTTLETSSRYKKRIEVIGEKGNLIYNFKAHEIFFAAADESERIAIPYKHADHLMESLKYVLNVVKEGGQFTQNTIWDAAKDMSVIKELLK